MKTRILGHLIAFVVLIGVGVWIAYQAVKAPMRIGPLLVDVELAAMYWFALLVYAFIVLMLYYPLRKRSWWALLIGHALAGTLAIVSTAIVVTLGHRNATSPSKAAESAAIGTDVEGSSAQPLPLPPGAGDAKKNQERFEENLL
jgi:hypothetical protein